MSDYLSVYIGQVNKSSALSYVVRGGADPAGRVRVRGHFQYSPDGQTGLVEYGDIIKMMREARQQNTVQRDVRVTSVPVLLGEFNIGQPVIKCFADKAKEVLGEQVHVISITNELQVRREDGRLYVPLKDIISALIVAQQTGRLSLGLHRSIDVKVDVEGFLRQLPGFYTQLYADSKDSAKYLEFFDRNDYAGVLSIAIACWYMFNEENGARQA